MLDVLTGFGSDPGLLRAHTYIPEGFPDNGPLVVVLHGCGQSAESYNNGSGWSTLAEECGVALLFPEQRWINNVFRGFNWFVPGDNRRGGGEPLSIRQMIGQVVDGHAIDPTRVFITGLSAGGAMTSVILATYPEVFAGGAIIGGLPYRTAGSTHLCAEPRYAPVTGRPSRSGMVAGTRSSTAPTPNPSFGNGRRSTRSRGRRPGWRRSTGFPGGSGATQASGW